MYIYLSILSIFLAFWGIYRSFKKKNMIIFVWLIIAYYTITSLVATLSPGNLQFGIEIKNTYMWSVLLCVAGFITSDILFNKETKKVISLDTLNRDGKVWRIIEVVYWISLGLTFLSLRNMDYVEYNTNNKGGGWAQCFFQLSACVNFLYVYKKKYIKLAVSIISVLMVVEAIHVRSFLFFPLMPVIFYFLYSRMANYDRFADFARKTTPMVIVLLISAIVVGLMRFGEFSLPETELTDIAFNSLDKWNLGNQYFVSTAHYFYRILGFFINMLSHIGISFPNPLDVYPSVPKLNAMLLNNASSVDLLENASHMPGTIFFDLYISWGYFCGLYAIIIYYFFIKLFQFVQKDTFTLILLSSTLGWHIYMLLRGAVDTCSSGISYAFWMSLHVLNIRNKMMKH